MSTIQIMMAAADKASDTNWPVVIITALVPAAVGAGSALLGVWLTQRAAAEAREHERIEKHRARKERGRLAALALADHLESFVLSCVQVVDSFRHTLWESPYSWADYAAEPKYLRALPDWPVLVSWSDLGAGVAVRAENFRRRVELKLDWLNALTLNDLPEDAHVEVANIAARLGIEAWDMAVDIRAGFGLAPFEWPEESNGAQEMNDHVSRIEKIAREQRDKDGDA